MKRYLTRNTALFAATAAVLIVAIRLFEMGFTSEQVSAKLYITFIGIIFLAAGVYTGLQLKRPARKRANPAVEVAANPLLTEREADVLACLARGMSNKEIASQLFVSENTVKKHINNLYFKLDVNRRTQAVARARELKLIA